MLVAIYSHCSLDLIKHYKNVPNVSGFSDSTGFDCLVQVSSAVLCFLNHVFTYGSGSQTLKLGPCSLTNIKLDTWGMVSLDWVGVMVTFIRLNPISQPAVLQGISFVQLNSGIKAFGIIVSFQQNPWSCFLFSQSLIETFCTNFQSPFLQKPTDLSAGHWSGSSTFRVPPTVTRKLFGTTACRNTGFMARYRSKHSFMHVIYHARYQL